MNELIVTFFAAILGNGFGAWNLRCLAAGRYWGVTIATIIAGTLNMTVIKRVVADGHQIIPYLLGTLCGFFLVMHFDKKNDCVTKADECSHKLSA